MTVRVIHPRLPGVAHTVPDGDLDRWVAQGWLPPAEDAPQPTSKPVKPATRRRKPTTEGSES